MQRPSRARDAASYRPRSIGLTGACVVTIAALAGALIGSRHGDGQSLAALAQESGKKDSTELTDTVLVGGKTVVCRVLDVTSDLVVVQVRSGAKQFFARSKVESLDRKADPDAQKVFRKYFRKAKTADNWSKLARFCSKSGLTPEYRQALRGLLDLEPDNSAAKRGLGMAQLDGRWLPERAVELKKGEGFTIEDGQLVPPKESTPPPKPEKDDDSSQQSSTKTVVKKVDPPPTLKILPRTRLSKREARLIEKKREESKENAKKFRERLENEYRPREWHETETDNFVILCNSTKDVARKYGAIMEMIRKKLRTMFRSKILRTQRAPVRIHANQEDFISTDQFARWGGRGLGGYYMPSNQSITTYHGTFGFTGTTYSVLAHEGTHYFQGLVLQGGFDNLPIWLIEGLAVYFGDGSKFDPESRNKITIGLIPRDRLAHLQEKMAAKRHTKIEKLVSMTRYSGFSGSHYADAWGLIYFLVNHPSKKGEKLLQKYWAIGLKRKLTKGDFLDLADHYFGDVDALEKEYIDYILELKSPPAGEIRGDYFVSDLFQFEFKAPGPDWEFFEDESDKKLLIGLTKPGTSAQIRIYYENNLENKKAPEFFKDYLKSTRDFEDVEHEKCKIAGLQGYKVSYVDTGERSFPFTLVREGGKIVVRGGGKDAKNGKSKKNEKDHRDVIKFMLIQVDGIASIECSTAKGEIGAYRDLFDSMNQNFNLILMRRW